MERARVHILRWNSHYLNPEVSKERWSTTLLLESELFPVLGIWKLLCGVPKPLDNGTFWRVKSISYMQWPATRSVKEAGTNLVIFTYRDLLFPKKESPFRLQKACPNRYLPLQNAGPRGTSSFHTSRQESFGGLCCLHEIPTAKLFNITESFFHHPVKLGCMNIW